MKNLFVSSMIQRLEIVEKYKKLAYISQRSVNKFFDKFLEAGRKWEYNVN